MNGVSVIIPTYNRQNYISKAIESIIAQDFEGDVEIIISDDGSTDNTLDIVKNYIEYIRIIKKPNNICKRGASAARNRGILAAKHDYICFLDSDDFFLPGHLKFMVSKMKSKPEISFAFCRLLEMDESYNKNLFRLWTKASITQRDIRLLTLSKHNVIQTNGFILKREVFDEIGLFDENLRNGEDNDLWMRISEVFKGDFCDNYGAIIRKHQLGQLTDVKENELREVNVDIFRRAIIRYKKLGLNDNFRIVKLYYVVIKYKALGIPFFKKIILVIEKLKFNKSNDLDWKPLHFFLNHKNGMEHNKKDSIVTFKLDKHS